MKNIILLFLLAPTYLLGFSIQAFDKDGIPKKPSPPRLVNIIEGTPEVFSVNQINQLEADLVSFSKSTGVQIVLAVVPNLNGYEKAQMATEIGQRWGVGEKGKDNGIVLLLKPKTSSSKGQVFIATGYGLEGVIPDAIGKRIVEIEMIPSFKHNDYYTGITKSISTLKGLALKEYSAKEYLYKTDSSSSGLSFLPFLIFIFVFLILRRRSSRRRNYSSSSVPFWTAMFLGGSVGRGSPGNWNDFSSGSGGFGGFGGGGFGGGGAGGSW